MIDGIDDDRYRCFSVHVVYMYQYRYPYSIDIIINPVEEVSLIPRSVIRTDDGADRRSIFTSNAKILFNG
jgi:hypothetical protein